MAGREALSCWGAGTALPEECLRAQPGASGRTLTACIFDVCFAGSRYALQDTVY